MKIGIITGDLNQSRTGIGTYIYHLVANLSSTFDITLIRHEDGTDIPGCDSIVIKNRIYRGYNSLFWNQSLRWHHYELTDFDIIHNPGQFLTPPVIGNTSVITIHDITPVLFPSYHFPFRTWSNRLFLPSLLRRSTRIIADSYHTKNDICTLYHVDPGKIDVIHLAADSRFKPLPEQDVKTWCLKKNLKNPYILFVGTIEPRKNIICLIEIFEQIAQSLSDLHLVISGKRGWHAEPILERINTSAYSKRIQYLNYLNFEELPYLYNGASAFVYPSWYEGFGLPPLEAMQCGTPVVCSNASSLPEVIGDGGILIDPHNIQGFSDAIVKIITDETYRLNQVQYGLERSHTFSWEKTARETATVFEQVIVDGNR